jgi:hypothetical protein
MVAIFRRPARVDFDLCALGKHVRLYTRCVMKQCLSPIRRSSRFGASRRPSAPLHFTNGSTLRFLRTNPMNHLLLCVWTQSTISAIPTTPPVWRFAGSSLWSKHACLSMFKEASTRNGPRYLVRQLRFSMFLDFVGQLGKGQPLELSGQFNNRYPHFDAQFRPEPPSVYHGK